jgi:hypothetical protein
MNQLKLTVSNNRWVLSLQEILLKFKIRKKLMKFVQNIKLKTQFMRKIINLVEIAPQEK